MKRTLLPLFFSLAAFGVSQTLAQNPEHKLVFEPQPGPGAGKRIVLIAGDEEYRSEETMPMLAKILSQRHGFKCTVLFSAAEDGTITPNDTTSLTNPEALDEADLLITSIRFRNWPKESLDRFEKLIAAGTPIIGLRTSTHAFKQNKLELFGKEVLGEKWVSHWGKHKAEATRGVVEPGAEGSSLLHGVTDVFGTTDVYEAHPPSDATILLRGQVLSGMTPESSPASYQKKRATDGMEQDVNNPMMPIAWTRLHASSGGKTNRVLCTTMGAADEFVNESLRRLIVNGAYWCLQLDVPSKANVEFVDEYKPGFYGNNGYRKGMKISDLGLGKAMPGEPNPMSGPAPKKDPVK